MKFNMFTVGAVLMHKHSIPNEEKPKKKWMGIKPVNCNACETSFKEVFIDGKTIYGPWALLCLECHSKIGTGLGTGRGQKYDLETLEKLEG